MSSEKVHSVVCNETIWVCTGNIEFWHSLPDISPEIVSLDDLHGSIDIIASSYHDHAPLPFTPTSTPTTVTLPLIQPISALYITVPPPSHFPTTPTTSLHYASRLPPNINTEEPTGLKRPNGRMGYQSTQSLASDLVRSYGR